MIEEFTLYRKNGKAPMVFKKDNAHYFFRGRKYLYRMFFTLGTKIWIGRLYNEHEGLGFWGACEHGLNADYFDFGNVRIIFTQTPGKQHANIR
jgi:hypothetical protein